MELDPELADPHVTLAIARLFWDWDWQAAGEELATALRLNPNLAMAHGVHALFLNTCGRIDEGLAAALRARDLDPLSVFTNMSVVWSHHFAGDHEAAIREAQRARDLVPGLEEAGNVLISSYEALGRYEEAAAIVAQQRCWGIQFDGEALAAAWREGGADAYWRARLAMLEELGPEAPAAVHFARAVACHHLGDRDGAIRQGARMVEAHVGGCVFIAVDPCLAALAGDPRYEALIRRVGVPLQRTASAPHTVST